jgi:hypothetical protein
MCSSVLSKGQLKHPHIKMASSCQSKGKANMLFLVIINLIFTVLWGMQRRTQQEEARCTNYNTRAHPKDLHMYV